jgi:Na+-translocating ferredoxin:NAD+ oxidoreductase RnfE subunit
MVMAAYLTDLHKALGWLFLNSSNCIIMEEQRLCHEDGVWIQCQWDWHGNRIPLALFLCLQFVKFGNGTGLNESDACYL